VPGAATPGAATAPGGANSTIPGVPNVPNIPGTGNPRS
jgi:hypothetical protein